jgi:hypothetical protein
MAQIACRLNAIRCVLEQVTEENQRKLISQTQVAALAAVMRESTLSPGELAEMSTLTCRIGLHASTLTDALSLFVPATAQLQTRRRRMQDYCSVCGFFTGSDWSRLLSATTTSHAKAHIIMSRVLRLGLRCPTEPCIKLLSTLSVFVADGTTNTDRVDFKVRLEEFKRMFKALSNLERDPVEYIDTLPPSPADMFRLHSLAYSACYSGVADDTPIGMPIDEDALKRLNNSYKCRGAGVPASTAVLKSAATMGAAQPADQMVQCMMMGFQQLQQSQMKMFAQLMGNSAPPEEPVTLTFAERSKRPEQVQLPGPAQRMLPHNSSGEAHPALADASPRAQVSHMSLISDGLAHKV